MVSGRKVASTIRSLVNGRDLQLEYASHFSYMILYVEGEGEV